MRKEEYCLRNIKSRRVRYDFFTIIIAPPSSKEAKVVPSDQKILIDAINKFQVVLHLYHNILGAVLNGDKADLIQDYDVDQTMEIWMEESESE